MLAFSIDYYGIFFRATQSVELFCTYYGKTGMGKAEGIVVDAWFTGFAETLEGNKYFCVYLGQSDAGNTSSTAAKEIAIQILNDNK